VIAVPPKALAVLWTLVGQLHIRRQAFGSGIGIERGEKGCKIFCEHFIEYCAARITWFVGLELSLAPTG
jgi:hypothetical protein